MYRSAIVQGECGESLRKTAMPMVIPCEAWEEETYDLECLTDSL
ncbi:hypothetical protein [Plesiomonas shigelloides]|nr:hypothetical protein [Plesiomonas shigelloides]